MNQPLKHVLLVCVCLHALSSQAIADSLSDALSAYKSGAYTKAAGLLNPLAEQGDAYAQFSLGVMYYSGQGVPQDYKEAAKWYRLAAEQGDVLAQFSLGFMYYSGQGVPQDYKEAAKWYRLAAEQGYAIAQGSLGMMYEHGEGVPQDYALSHMWLNVATATADRKKQEKFVKWRDLVAKHMTAQQIAEAQQLARKCTANKFKGC